MALCGLTLAQSLSPMAAQTPVPATAADPHTFVDANRPRFEPRALSAPEQAAMRKAISTWKGKKTEAALADVRPYAEAGDPAALRVMMDGWIHLRKSPGSRGASKALTNPDQALIPLSGLWAMAVWSHGDRSREVAKALDVCMKGGSENIPTERFDFYKSPMGVLSLTRDYDCGLTTRSTAAGISRLLDFARENKFANQFKNSPWPEFVFIERPIKNATQLEEERFERALGSYQTYLRYTNGMSQDEMMWARTYISTRPADAARWRTVEFNAEIANVYEGRRPYPGSWFWAYMEADPARKAQYEQAVLMAQINGAERSAKFDKTIETAKPEDRDWMARVALSEGGPKALAWWSRFQFTLDKEGAYAFTPWCNAGVEAACKRGEEVRARDQARQTAQSSGSSYSGADPAASVQGIIDRNNAVNAANCARASQGASIICNP
jgi:hypothetical protein